MENRSAFDKSNRSEAARSHHRILSLSINGGFLDGARLEFSDGLNCIIGGRGTGKTTVLEFIRYILGMLPDGSDARPRVKATQSHVRNNLGSGTIILDVETKHGRGPRCSQEASGTAQRPPSASGGGANFRSLGASPCAGNWGDRRSFTPDWLA